MVAVNNKVLVVLGISLKIVSTSVCKAPIISSASSNTKYEIVVISIALRSIRSSKRPGVATTICVVLFNTSTWDLRVAPPKSPTTEISGL